jgi:two-component system LytT family response regulator
MNCIVVDDEPLARKGMQMLIEQVPKLTLKGVFSNALEADEYLKNNPVDILFLDIQMPKINGMEFIKSSKHSVKVVITTAYPQFAVEAFELDVTDYLVKPIRFERFYKTINKITSEKNTKTGNVVNDDDYIFIRTERKYIRTNYNEIDFIEGLKDYVIVHCGDSRHMVASNLKSIHAGLPKNLFLRVNKSYIINVSKIKSIDSEWVVIQSKQLPIGENFKKSVFEFIEQKKIMRRN